MHYEFIYRLRSFPSAGDGSHYETGTVSGITTYEDVVRIVGPQIKGKSQNAQGNNDDENHDGSPNNRPRPYSLLRGFSRLILELAFCYKHVVTHMDIIGPKRGPINAPKREKKPELTRASFLL